jgi:tetratricopeptide (TPR) repeat protein
MTGWVLTQMRQWDAADMTLSQAAACAPAPLDAASVVKTRIWLHLRRGDLPAAIEAAQAAAYDIEPRWSRATPAELSLWGHLQLNIANAAVRDNRSREADDALKLAGSAATRIGREIMSDPSTTRVFGPWTVACARAEIAVLDDRPDKTLSIKERIPAAAFPADDMTLLRHQLDVAHAYTLRKKYPEAVSMFSRIRSAAPEWLPRQRYGRDIFARIVEERRTVTPEMNDIADLVGVPL